MIATNPSYSLNLGDFVTLDCNENGYNELYCSKWYDEIGFNAVIFELDSLSNFNLIYNYPDTVNWAVNKYNIDGDGTDEMILTCNGSRGIYIYQKDSILNLPVNLDFFYSFNPDFQIDWRTFGDFDNDGVTDYAFWTDNTTSIYLGIYEFNAFSRTFDSIYAYSPSSPSSSILVDDLDGDNKTDLAFAESYGGIGVIENISNNQYSLVWYDDVDLYNSYYVNVTNDFNKNGLKELWLIGEELSNSQTVLYAFEAVSDNVYKPFFKIILKNSSVGGYTKVISRDINYDGTEELIICLGNSILMLNLFIIDNKVYSNIFYYNVIDIGSRFVDNVSFLDLENKGYLNMLFAYNDRYSFIFRKRIITNIEIAPNNYLNNFHLTQNYPNPFNPITMIKYDLPEDARVLLRIYDILGREVVELVNEERPTGSYEVEFNAGTLASGIYFYRIQAGSFVDTKKMILLK